MIEKITSERINKFLEGYDPMEHIINIECSYDDKEAIIIYNDAKGVKRMKREAFYPFVWAKQSAARQLYGGDRKLLLKKMAEYGIATKGLNIYNNKGKTTERLENGYRVMFYAKFSMPFKKFSQFFVEGKKPIYSNDKNSTGNSKEFLAITPVEQFMISTGKRLFKGYDDYDQLKRLEWDLETQGLEAEKCAINQIGIRTNKGFEKIITITGEGEERLQNELEAIRECLRIIGSEKPDVITGHNSENFDWDFLIKRLALLGTSMQVESAKYFPKSIYKKKKQSVLKLGGEIEYYYPTVIWGFNVTDSLHAVRRAQAQDSNMKKADLKYVTKYSKLNKPNRVYVPGNDINTTWADTANEYAFNNENGQWFKITDKTFSKTYNEVIDKKQLTFYTEQEIENASKKLTEIQSYTHDKTELLKHEEEINKLNEIASGNKFEEITEEKIRYTLLEDGTIKDNSTNEIYEKTTGRYIVERYLLDDLYETDKVELRYNQSNFLLGKLLPTTFGKVCTMGTAATWKMIMLAWSYENDLALPSYASSGAFTGGLSRLLSVGYIDRVVKLDYNSLYPSIILSWMISTGEDISGVMLALLEYILSEREKFKGLKSVAGKKAKKKKEYIETFLGTTEELKLLKEELQKYESEESANDKKQLPFKIFGNSFFGGFGAPNLFNWGDLMCAEKTTCIGRQSLRLMNKWFKDRGYKPIVMDSVTYDTPLMIKNDNGDIDILPICDIFNENEKIEFDKEQYRDFSSKGYKVLTRNGWQNIEYVYKHKTNKDIHRIITKNGLIDVTSDHSLFDENKNEIKPSNIKRGDKIEIYNNNINFNINNEYDYNKAWLIGFFIADGSAIYCDNSICGEWKISNKSLDRLNKAKYILETYFNVKSDIKNHIKSSGVYNLIVYNTKFAKYFCDTCYTSYRYKKVPSFIINSNLDAYKGFIDGFCCGDGEGDYLADCVMFGQKSKVTMAGLYFMLNKLNVNFRISTRKDKQEFISFIFKNRHHNNINDTYSLKEINEVWNNDIIKPKNNYVYDISSDGTFVNVLGMIVAHNTDGVNFQMPPEEELNKRHYIGKGLNRNTKEGQEYHGVEADVAEFNDLFMRGKMGLGIDEYAQATINFSRKNYADYLENGKTKLVGNTIKSKKMPLYIEKFMNKAIDLLLFGKGQEFLIMYYDYIDKIYNLKIPLKEIASVGKIKKDLSEYIKDCGNVTAAGSKKARQAWYELAIKHNLNVHMGDSIYYINTGKSKSHSDVKRVTHYYTIEGEEKIEITKEVDKMWTAYRKKVKNNERDLPVYKDKVECAKAEYPNLTEEDELIFNCILLDNEIVEDENDTFCDEDTEYNVQKYLEQFNKRIKPLLVCFSKDIRDKILINNPEDRNYFTVDQSKLVSGEPYKSTDQDTYEQLMTIEDKEIRFWKSACEVPPFVEECGINWQEVLEDYDARQKQLEEIEIKEEADTYNKIIDSLTKEDVNKFMEDGDLPAQLLKIVEEDVNSNNFISKKWKVVIGNIFDIIDKDFDKIAEEKYNDYMDSFQ